MGTRQHKWRNTNTIFVDSRTGSDLTGDGSQYKPYQSIHRALYHNQPTAEIPTSIPTIVWRGVCTGQLSFGCVGNIKGSAWGEAIYDGKGIYTDYGFYHSNAIILNTVPANNSTPLGNWTSNRVPAFAGVGSPSAARYVGGAGDVFGVYGSSVLIHNSPVYWGCLHNSGGQNTIYSCITHHDTYKLTFGGTSTQQSYNTYYHCRANDQRLDTNLTLAVHLHNLYVDFDILVNNRLTFKQCLFTKDCGFYYFKNSNYYRIIIDETITTESTSIAENATEKTCTIGGGTIAEFIASQIESGVSLEQAKQNAIPTAVSALKTANYISTNVTFTECKFSTQTADETFNNAEALDFTLKLTSDAVQGYSSLEGKDYFGAMPPALNIPILETSDGIPQAWEARSFRGLLKIDGDKIVINEESNETTGEARTKIITLNSLLTQDKVLTGIFTMFSEKFQKYGLSFWDEWPVIDNENPITVTSTEQVLTNGIANAPAYYIVKGDENTRVKVTINGDILEGSDALKHGQIIFATLNDTVKVCLDPTDGGTPVTLLNILDSNMPDCIYVRMQQTIYAQAESGEIKATATYLNSGNSTITYNGHEVVQGESFEGVNGVTEFTGAPTGYKVDVVFDDDTVNPLVPNGEWIPASMWDNFYINCDNQKNTYYLGWNNDTTPKAITTTKVANSAPASSGNYLSRVTTTGNILYMGEKYLQFRLFCKKVF